ncbi:MAG: hypothetical protein K8F59_16570, partial [Rhodobacteraceae bacterium]|nr:hypothetical protein [Paracoccaceae bacterium]
MVTDIVFDPLLPTAALALLAAIAALLLAFGIWRGLAGWPFRASAALVLLVALANPALRREERDSLSDIVLLAVDRSSSQAIAGRPSQVEAALADMQAQLAGLENVEVRLVELADAPPETDAGTLLMTALSEAAAGVARDRIAGAILITDGQVHDLALAPDLPAPAHVLLSGSARDFDRRLAVLDAPAFAIMGEAVTLKLRIEDAGVVPAGLPASTDLVIAVDGGPPQRFTVRVGEDLELPLKLRHGGQNVLQFSVPEVAGELTARNNDAVITINGVRDRLRVLLVSGEPHAGERTWRNLLKSDSSVDLVHFTILRPPGKQDGVPVTELSLIAFPTRELFLDKIDEFDLIIFDRYRRRGILPSAYLDNVARYVENGGAVLVAAGPAFAGAESLYRSPLARVLPGEPTARVYQTGYVPMISETGARHPVTEGLENFAPRPRDADGRPGWGRWLRMIEVAPRSGHTVMTGPEDKPLLILDRVGRGRIALLASDQAWLWHRGYEGGGPQLELLRRLAHWMMKEPELEEEALSAVAKGRNVTVTRRSLKQGARVLTLTGPEGNSREIAMDEVSPGRYVARFEGAENGLYRLREADLETVVALGPAAPKE